MIDQSSINLLELIGGQLKKVSGTRGGEWHGPCPFCGGKDRFRIQPHANNNGGVWQCRQCERGGDAIKFVMERDNCDFKTAMRTLQLRSNWRRPRNLIDRKRMRTKLHIKKETVTGWHSDDWQTEAEAVIDRARRELENLPHIQAYLKRRGITENAMKNAQLGFLSERYEGKHFILPRGIMIPHKYNGLVTLLQVRQGKGQNPKYLTARGSTTKYLYSSNDIFTLIRDIRILILVESAFDAIAINALNITGLKALALTSTTAGRRAREDGIMDGIDTAIITDNDDAGRACAEWWGSRIIMPPEPYNDVGAMFQDNYDVRAWLMSKLNLSDPMPVGSADKSISRLSLTEPLIISPPRAEEPAIEWPTTRIEVLKGNPAPAGKVIVVGRPQRIIGESGLDYSYDVLELDTALGMALRGAYPVNAGAGESLDKMRERISRGAKIVIDGWDMTDFLL